MNNYKNMNKKSIRLKRNVEIEIINNRNVIQYIKKMFLIYKILIEKEILLLQLRRWTIYSVSFSNIKFNPKHLFK